MGKLNAGASKDGFLQTTLKILLILGYPKYFRSLEMHSKRRYKFFICSVILAIGELKSFRKYEGVSIIFQKILGAI